MKSKLIAAFILLIAVSCKKETPKTKTTYIFEGYQGLYLNDNYTGVSIGNGFLQGNITLEEGTSAKVEAVSIFNTDAMLIVKKDGIVIFSEKKLNSVSYIINN